MGIHPEPLVYLFGSRYIAINYATVFNSIVVMGLLILLFYLLGRNIRTRPGKAQMAVEFIVDAFDGFCEQALGKMRGRKFLPYIGSLFLYIWGMNLIGIIPLPGFRIFGFPVPAIQDVRGRSAYDGSTRQSGFQPRRTNRQDVRFDSRTPFSKPECGTVERCAPTPSPFFR